MTTFTPRTMTNDESLKLLGLFKLATEHYAKAREFEFALNRALGKADNEQGAISDAIYREIKWSTEDFYIALELEGFHVEGRGPLTNDQIAATWLENRSEDSNG